MRSLITPGDWWEFKPGDRVRGKDYGFAAGKVGVIESISIVFPGCYHINIDGKPVVCSGTWFCREGDPGRAVRVPASADQVEKVEETSSEGGEGPGH